MNNKDFSKTLTGLSPYEVFEYATYLPPRTSIHGKFRRHKTLGHAKTALANSNIYWGSTPTTEVPTVYKFDQSIKQWKPILTFNPRSGEFTMVV